MEILIQADLTPSPETWEPVNSETTSKLAKNPQGRCCQGAGAAPHEMAAPSDAAVTPPRGQELAPHPDGPGAQLSAGSLSDEDY